MINIDINVSVLLKEYPFLQRFSEAAKLGFDTVEFYWEKDLDVKQVSQRILDADLRVAAFNFDVGDMASGDRGLLNDPAFLERMEQNVPLAIDLAERVGCKKITALAGNLLPDEDREKQIERIRKNLRRVCERTAEAGITVMVEAINHWDNKLYPFTNTPDTIEFLDSVEMPNLKYLFDMYHMQRTEGNVTANLEKYIDKIGHIQIADSPKRNHPGSGEINFNYLFSEIERVGYKGSVGLEYNPLGSTEESLSWLPVAYRKNFDLNSFTI